MQDFKVRAVDFLSIYVKSKSYTSDPTVQIKLIRGLLKGLSSAHTDKHQILFERIKSVLALLAKQGQSSGNQAATAGNKKAANGQQEETKLLLSEISRLVLK